MIRRTALIEVGVLALLAWLVLYPVGIVAAQAADPAALVAFVGRPAEWRALWASVWISVASVGLAAAIGVPLAFLFEWLEFPGRRVLGVLVALPVVLPPLVGVLAFLFLYGESGFVARGLEAVLGLKRAPWQLRGPLAILLVHAYSMYAYFYMLVRAGLARLDVSLLEAAQALGVGWWGTLRRVTLPLLRPALVGAALLTFLTALGSFSAPYVFGGGFRVMPTQIVASKLNGDLSLAMVETMALTLVAVAGLVILGRAERDTTLVTPGKGTGPRRRALHSRGARIAAAVAGWLGGLVLLLPHLTLVLVSLVPYATWTTEAVPPVLSLANYARLVREPDRLWPLLNSAWMATAATAGAMALAVVAGWLVVRQRVRTRRLVEGLVLLPWALPGTVFAVALATAFAVSRPLALRWVLVGTVAILPLAYLVRALPLTGRAVLAGYRQLDPALEDAAASLGAERWATLWRVTVPLLEPALAAGATLAFVTALGDFVTSIVLYTYDTRPISIEILSSLRLNEIGIAAAFGVVVMLASGLVLALGTRR
ncbi:MAG TPA: iron ABC transporter permease [Gemmatimonadales bacterium]|nr:iron ABC transporter permease [Gemmatimonadales bacterium]